MIKVGNVRSWGICGGRGRLVLRKLVGLTLDGEGGDRSKLWDPEVPRQRKAFGERRLSEWDFHLHFY